MLLSSNYQMNINNAKITQKGIQVSSFTPANTHNDIQLGITKYEITLFERK